MPTFGNWLLQESAKKVPLALAGMAAAAGIGFLASKGQMRGTTEGLAGAGGGGFSGAMSGIVLGGMAGAGLVGAAMYAPKNLINTVRPAVGRFLGSVIATSPVQKIASTLGTAPVTGRAGQSLAGLSKFMQEFANPQGAAADHLIQMLERKAASKMMYGAVPGMIAGGMLGGGLGYLTGAWRGGSRLTGPMSSTY